MNWQKLSWPSAVILVASRGHSELHACDVAAASRAITTLDESAAAASMVLQ